LSPKAAEVLTLAIHELATNSIKYGALAKRGGQLEIAWDLERRGGQSWLAFRWDETRIGQVGPFKREGFGTELITRRVPYELRGTGSLEPQNDGIAARIEFPLEPGSSILETGSTEHTQ
jgi:two-component sensor histidine kinase